MPPERSMSASGRAAPWRSGGRPWRAPVAAGHIGLSPGFVDEHQALGVKPALVFLPLGPPAGENRRGPAHWRVASPRRIAATRVLQCRCPTSGSASSHEGFVFRVPDSGQPQCSARLLPNQRTRSFLGTRTIRPASGPSRPTADRRSEAAKQRFRDNEARGITQFCARPPASEPPGPTLLEHGIGREPIFIAVTIRRERIRRRIGQLGAADIARLNCGAGLRDGSRGLVRGQI